jgi:hypothetical protein
MRQAMQAFFDAPQFSDLVFIVGDQRIHAVLSTAPARPLPYFSRPGVPNASSVVHSTGRWWRPGAPSWRPSCAAASASRRRARSPSATTPTRSSASSSRWPLSRPLSRCAFLAL